MLWYRKQQDGVVGRLLEGLEGWSGMETFGGLGVSMGACLFEVHDAAGGHTNHV